MKSNFSFLFFQKFINPFKEIVVLFIFPGLFSQVADNVIFNGTNETEFVDEYGSWNVDEWSYSITTFYDLLNDSYEDVPVKLGIPDIEPDEEFYSYFIP